MICTNQEHLWVLIQTTKLINYIPMVSNRLRLLLTIGSLRHTARVSPAEMSDMINHKHVEICKLY